MSYTPETAISAVTWPNGWGEGAHGINAACIQLGVKTLADLDALMEDPERQKKFKTAINDRPGPFNFAFNLADKVCAGKAHFGSLQNSADAAKRKAEESRPAPKFPKAPAPRPTETEDPDESDEPQSEHVMPRTGHRIQRATLEDMDTALQDILTGLTFGEIDRKREWGKNRISRWRNKHEVFKQASNAAVEAYQKTLRTGKAKTTQDDVVAPDKTPRKTDTLAQDVVEPSASDDTEPFPPFPEPAFESKDDLPAIEDGPADFVSEQIRQDEAEASRRETLAAARNDDYDTRPTDKLPERFLPTEAAEAVPPVADKSVLARKRWFVLTQPASAVSFLERQIVAHVVSAAKSDYPCSNLSRDKLIQMGDLLITARAEEAARE